MEHQPDNPKLDEGKPERMELLNLAFEAYLTLPDVDDNNPDALREFTDFYVDSFPDMTTLLNEITEAKEWQNQINILATQLGIDGLAYLDQRKLADLAQEIWDIVDIGGWLHVFTR